MLSLEGRRQDIELSVFSLSARYTLNISALLGVHLSIGDLVMLVTVVVVAGSTWHLVGNRA